LPAGRRALTMLELLIAMAIMAMVVVTLGAVARGVQEGYTYTEGHGTATQHARVVLERITAAVREATANSEFPGALVVNAEEGGWEFPDALVVWQGEPVDSEGQPRPPQFNELVIYCPDRSLPNRLVELTVPDNANEVPDADDTEGWEAAIDAIRRSGSARTLMLTDLLQTARVGDTPLSRPRGAVRFAVRMRPSADKWAEYREKIETGEEDLWDDLAWVQGIHGSETGLRQVWVRVELQLMPGNRAAAGATASTTPVPALGSAAVYYQLER